MMERSKTDVWVGLFVLLGAAGPLTGCSLFQSARRGRNPAAAMASNQ
jgi:hypothetical protein